MMLMIFARAIIIVLVLGMRQSVTLGLVELMFTWTGSIFFLRGLGAGRPDNGDTATAAGVGPSVVAAAAAAAGVVDEQALDARQLRELHHGATQIKVCRWTYLD